MEQSDNLPSEEIERQEHLKNKKEAADVQEKTNVIKNNDGKQNEDENDTCNPKEDTDIQNDSKENVVEAKDFTEKNGEEITSVVAEIKGKK